MKILNVVDGSGWTGGVEQALLLTEELRRLGIDARLAVHGANAVYGEARSRGIPVYIYEKEGGRFAASRLLHLLKGKYDFVIGHKPGALRHLILPLLLRGRHSRSIGVRRVSYPVSRLTVYRFPEHVVAVSNSVREVLLAGGLRGERITVIPSGVDTDLFRFSPDQRKASRERLGLGRKRMILNLAKFVPEQKGQGHLLAAAAALKETFPLAVCLAGLETDGAGARKAVAGLGLEGTVRLLGFRRDIPELINASDVFVFPSLPGLDAIAGSVLQAMACGRVTVASAVGGIPEYLHDGENGFLVPPGDTQRLRDALERALTLDDGERERIGRNAREAVLGKYSKGTMALAYQDLFRKMHKGPER